MQKTKEFFQECEKEIQQRDYIHELSKLVKTDADKNVFEQTLKRWLIASVANIYEDRNTNPICLVLCGGQGFNKSYLFDYLDFPAAHSFNGRLSLKQQDENDLLLLTDKFLIILDEQFSVLKKKEEREYFKKLITMSDVKVRKPYEKTAKKHQRIANFCGASNLNKDELNSLGNRLLAFNLTSPIQADELKKIPVNKIWGQAYQLYKQSKK